MGAPDLLQQLRGAGLSINVRGDKLVVTPASLLTDADRAAIRSLKLELVELVLGRGRPHGDQDTTNDRACLACRHCGEYRNCVEPVAAGLASKFSIVWPPEAHATLCPAFVQKERNK